jgi:hypothetical protein
LRRFEFRAHCKLNVYFSRKKVPPEFQQTAQIKSILDRDLISLSVIFTENWYISVFRVYPEI